MIKKLHLIVLFSCICISSLQSQHTWYENSSNTNHINLESASNGTFTTDEINPETSGINSNATVSKFVRDGQEGSKITFDLGNPITDFYSYTISLKAHTSIQTADINSTNRRIRVYLKNTSTSGTSVFKASNFTTGETWESFTFDFDGTAIPPEVIAAGGYNQMSINFASGDDGGLTSTYHIVNHSNILGIRRKPTMYTLTESTSTQP